MSEQETAQELNRLRAELEEARAHVGELLVLPCIISPELEQARRQMATRAAARAWLSPVVDVPRQRAEGERGKQVEE